MPVKLQKWGHSVGVRLPKPMLEQIGLSEGAQVDVLVEGDHLVIRRARRRPTLDELLDQCKPENRPETIDFGPPVGREIIRGLHAGYVPERGDFVAYGARSVMRREQSGERPALVLSTRRFNSLTGYAFVAPITRTARGWPFEVPIEPGHRVGGWFFRIRQGASISRHGTLASLARRRHG